MMGDEQLLDIMELNLLKKFIIQSNVIEGINRNEEELQKDIVAHRELLEQKELTVENVSDFVCAISGAKLRDKKGMNVRIGSYKLPKGGEHIRSKLKMFLKDVNTGTFSIYFAHNFYEDLHPFMDGNGRSGRAIWLWHMAHNKDVHYTKILAKRDFLHEWYYQSLEAWRS